MIVRQLAGTMVEVNPTDEADICRRLTSCIGDSMSYAEIARRSGINAATVRRYLIGHAPSVAFLAWAVRDIGVNPYHVLLGFGPTEDQERRATELAETPTEVLYAEIARRHRALEEAVLRGGDHAGEAPPQTTPAAQGAAPLLSGATGR